MLSPPCKKEIAIYMKRKRGNMKKQKGAKARMQKKPMADGTMGHQVCAGGALINCNDVSIREKN